MYGPFLNALVCLIASALAGLGTGFVGMSAAVAITPMLMGFLGIDHFVATAIALASDVLASAIAAFTYGKHKNIDIKNGLILMVTVIVFTIGGTITGYYVPNTTMSIGTIITVSVISLKLIFFPSKGLMKDKTLTKTNKAITSILAGALIGFVCGFVGAGGGMMLLLVLTVFLGYDMHKAVGTSVFVMTFSALVGSSFHIIYDGFLTPTPKFNFDGTTYYLLALCSIFTLIFSLLASKLANRLKPNALSIVSGIMLLCLIITVTIVQNTDVITRYVNFGLIGLNLDIILVFSIIFLDKTRRGKNKNEKEK